MLFIQTMTATSEWPTQMLRPSEFDTPHSRPLLLTFYSSALVPRSPFAPYITAINSDWHRAPLLDTLDPHVV